MRLPLCTTYVGAIAILFLFSIMMLESKLSNFSKNSLKYFPVGIIFGSIFLIVLFYEISLFLESNYNSNYFYLNVYQN
jgi:NADH:ubiquinone oxidoreductase subunit 6 (subunit J)